MIVHKIRCEAREAVISARVRYLHSIYTDVVDLDSLRRRVKLGVSPLVAYNLNYFSTTGIVYSFTLDATENNNASFTADVIKPLAHGTATFTPTAGNALTRENIRTFTITDSFGGLIDVKNDQYCNEIGPSEPNYEYPITGRVGVDEMVTTFIELTLRDALSPKTDAAAPRPASAPPIAMVDTLNFTTTLNIGVTSKVTFTPAGTNLQLMDAMLPLSSMRTDKHQVIIGMALSQVYAPPGTTLAAKRFLWAASTAAGANNFTRSTNPRLILATPNANVTGESIALEAVNNQILRFEVPKSLVVVP